MTRTMPPPRAVPLVSANLRHRMYGTIDLWANAIDWYATEHERDVALARSVNLKANFLTKLTSVSGNEEAQRIAADIIQPCCGYIDSTSIVFEPK